MNKTVSLKISGRVQNVGFRYHARKKANEYNIAGFVKNEYDGSVYTEASGKAEDIDRFIIWCNSGPGWARVDNVNVQEMPFHEFDGFDVK